VIEQSRTSLRFENDGTGRRELYLRIKAQSEAGVQQWGQVVFGYNAATERLEIPLIRVRKADGTLVETPPTSIQDLSSPVERIAPVYTDFRQKHATGFYRDVIDYCLDAENITLDDIDLIVRNC